MNQIQREAFGEYLKALRSAKGLTQREAAEQSEISAPYLAQLERGQRNPPSREILARIAAAYTAEEDQLFRAAGYLPAEETKRFLDGIDLRRLDWAFDTIIRDPNFALGTRMSKKKIAPEVKAWAVELYLRTMDITLLKEEEVLALKEIIGYAGIAIPGCQAE